MDSIALKATSALIIFLVAISCGYFALAIRRSRHAEQLFSKLEDFSNGIFFGAALLHLLPEAMTRFHDLYPNSRFPWVFLLCACSIVLLFAIDRGLRNFQFSVKPSTLFTIIVCILLSIHAFFAGIALGIDDSMHTILILFIAILAHKGAASFALTTNMIASRINYRRIWQTLLLFSLMTPLGIAFGDMLSHLLLHRTAQVSEAVFNAIAAGTFIYVAISNSQHTHLRKNGQYVLYFIAGIALMSVIAIWV